MKTALIVLVVVLCFAACCRAATAITFGWRSYSGDVCQDRKSEPTGVKTIGIGYRSGLLRILDVAFGLDYSWGDVGGICEGCKDNETGFRHVAFRASGAVPVVSRSVTKIYVGGGASYDMLDSHSIGCPKDESRVGFFGLVGVSFKIPGVPLSAYAEGQVERLTGEPSITVSSLLLGAGIGF